MSEERAFLRDAMRELRAQKAEAVASWLEGRRAAGVARWTDKSALHAVRLCVERALLREEWRDVISAVRLVARDPYGNPWKIETEVMTVGGSRREREHFEQKMRERAEGYRLGT